MDDQFKFEIECLKCRKLLKCSFGAAGKKVKCPKCGEMMIASPFDGAGGALPIPEPVNTVPTSVVSQSPPKVEEPPPIVLVKSVPPVSEKPVIEAMPSASIDSKPVETAPDPFLLPSRLPLKIKTPKSYPSDQSRHFVTGFGFQR